MTPAQLTRLIRKHATIERGEGWRLVPGWPFYAVSNLGRVVSLPRHGKSLTVLSPHLKDDGRWLRLSENGISWTAHVPRLVLLAFAGDPPPSHKRLSVVHVNDDVYDDRLVNLRWGTTYATDRQRDLSSMVRVGAEAGVSAAEAGRRIGTSVRMACRLSSILREALGFPRRASWPEVARAALDRRVDLLDVVRLRGGPNDSRMTM